MLTHYTGVVQKHWYEYHKGSDELKRVLNRRYEESRSVTGFMSPSGRITVGSLPRAKELKSDKEYESSRPLTSSYDLCHWDAYAGIIKEKHVVTLEPPSVGLSAEANHHSGGSRRYGLRGITRNGCNKVLEGSKLLERRYPGKLGFYTLTCPYLDSSLIYEFNRNIGEIQRRYFQDLRRLYDKKCCNFNYVSVIELQSKRYESSGEWALHIHYLAPCFVRQSREWVLNADELRYLWMRSCAAVVGIEADTSASVDAQLVKKSASGYLAKYLSKGSGNVDFIADIAPSQVPGQWWSMSAKVRKGISALTMQISQPLSEWWFEGNNFSEGEPYHLTYKRDIYIEWRGQSLRVGLSGQLDKRGAAMFICPYKWLKVMLTL